MSETDRLIQGGIDLIMGKVKELINLAEKFKNLDFE